MNVFHTRAICCLVRLARFSSAIKMATNNVLKQDSTLTPPPHVRGMTVLDREKFKAVVEVPYVVVSANEMKTTFKILKPCLLKMRKLNPVCDENLNNKRILLHPCKYEDKLLSIQETSNNLTLGGISWTNVTLEYDNWSSEEIFKAVLPEDSVGNVSSFSIIGHIIHLNLKEELLDYKFLIGQVLLDKYPNIKTVVNKCETIDNKFRNFKMEHLVGERNYQVVVKENNFRYAFDFEKVFWNPRLGSERNEMTRRVQSKDLIYDVFAGVGPFTIPMAKKGCHVHANDLNPDSYHWLCHNAKFNKVEQNIQTYNLDGNEFILTIVRRGLVEYFNSEDENVGDFHILMNLPAIAVTFLKAFNELLTGEVVKSDSNMPIVHCYFFKRKEEEASEVLGYFLDDELVKGAEITTVRVVAPNKLMMRISYKLTKDILFYKNDPSSEPTAKRIKLSAECDLKTS